MKQQVHYINISESRTLYVNLNGTTTMKMIREACIQRADDLDGSVNNHCRVYRGISEASILRLAKIQEKLANKDRMVWLECPNCKCSLGFVYEYLIQCGSKWTFPKNDTCGHCEKEIEAGTYMPEIEKDF